MLTVGLHIGRRDGVLPTAAVFHYRTSRRPVEPRGRARRSFEHHGHGGAQDAGVGPVVAQGGSQPVVGDAVAAGERDALDEPAQPQTAQVVGHAAAAVLLDGEGEQR